jgi:molecular chaperone DnaK (HSP70)
MKVEGRSFQENVVEFYTEINDWLDGYLLTDFGTLTFDCMIEYFNSSTTKLLMNMLIKMDKYASAEKKIIVNWIADRQNDIMIECGEDFKDEMENVEFNLIVK